MERYAARLPECYTAFLQPNAKLDCVMTRLAIWLFAFSPMSLALIPAVRDRWGSVLPFITCITLVVAIALELVVVRRRGAAEMPSTPIGNWFAKAFGILFVVAIVLIVVVGICSCVTI